MASQLPERFFIAGCQRSGTTLMRLALECHPEVMCLDETRSYDALAGGPVEVPPGITRLGFKIPRWTERLGEAGGELPPEPFYRGERVVFLLRDLRDSVASMRALHQGGKDWLSTWGRPILEGRIRDDPAFRDRYGREIEQVRASGDDPCAVGALYWVAKTQSYFDYAGRGLPVLPVRYEGLVRSPERHFREILRFLGLDWDPGALDHPTFPHGELFPGGTTVGETDPNRKIDESSVGRWRSSLTEADEARVLAIGGDLNRRVASIPTPP